jgi:MoaA/NifB/PqqE/SkfB family radical SAM enzyme
MAYPSFIQWYPTLRCNQKCSFCFNQIVSDMNYRQDMTERAAFLLADNLILKGIMELDILGGEPLLVPYIKDFIRYITGAGIAVNISTNGSLPDMVQTLSRIPTELLNIGFSLHGLADTHNAITKSDNFKCVIEGIRRVLNEGKNPIVKSVLTSTNRKEISV